MTSLSQAWILATIAVCGPSSHLHELDLVLGDAMQLQFFISKRNFKKAN
jgi:hypothetical protein